MTTMPPPPRSYCPISRPAAVSELRKFLLFLSRRLTRSTSSSAKSSELNSPLHWANVLYYLYTNKIIFCTSDSHQHSVSATPECSAKSMYKLADRMRLNVPRLAYCKRRCLLSIVWAGRAQSPRARIIAIPGSHCVTRVTQKF